jgi:enediyne biosynthesis protein E5
MIISVRVQQILLLFTLLLIGISREIIQLELWALPLALLSGLVLQGIGDSKRRRKWNIASVTISCLSLCLLLRTQNPYVLFYAIFFTVLSKFLIVYKGQHFFNPTNFGIVVCLTVFPNLSWVSPGQWGNYFFPSLALSVIGVLVARNAQRLLTAFSFLSFYSLMLLTRYLYLGDPLSIFTHQLKSFSLVIFCFFMITDPRTTPRSFKGQILYTFLIALTGYLLQFHFYIREGLFYALFFICLLNPLINKLFPAKEYQWAKNT